MGECALTLSVRGAEVGWAEVDMPVRGAEVDMPVRGEEVNMSVRAAEVSVSVRGAEVNVPVRGAEVDVLVTVGAEIDVKWQRSTCRCERQGRDGSSSMPTI